MSGWTILRHSIRIFKNDWSFAVLTVVMLALGIGACTAIFTVTDAVLLKSLPYPEADRLVQLEEISARGTPMNVPEANFVDWRDGSHSYEAMAMFASGGTDVMRIRNQATRVKYAIVSRDFFDILKVRPLIGSGLLPEHFRADASPSAIISYGLWKRAFGGAPDLEDERIDDEGKILAVVGVMPPDFNLPAGNELWAPRELYGEFNPSRSAHNFSVLARLKHGVDAAGATRELGTIAKSIHDHFQDVTAVSAVALPLGEHLTESVSLALRVLLAAVGILLVVACANVTNLTLTHIRSRQREFAVRTALGASPWVLIRLFLSQSLILTTIGGVFGVGVSIIGVPALLALGSGSLPRFEEIRTDWRVLLFAVAISLMVGVVLGLVPAFGLGRINLDDMLKEGGRSQTSGAVAKTIRGALVVAQVAMTMVLLIAAALLGRSFVNILQVDLGFKTESRFAIEIMVPTATDSDPRRTRNESREVIDAVANMPGVIAVGGVSTMPLTHSNRNGRFQIEGGTNSGDYWPLYNIATPGFFTAMGVPLIRGRVFQSSDSGDTPEVAVISQSVAQHVWPGEDPIGKRINFGNMDGDEKFMTIIGVVGDVRSDPTEPALGAIYVNYLQRGSTSAFNLVVRRAGDSENLQRAVATRIRQTNPDASLRIQTLDQMFSANLRNRRFNLALLGVFGGAALLLALMGIYAVTSYSVTQRTAEIGIRMALGANPGSVSRMFLTEGTKLVLAGVLLGVAFALAVSRVLSSLLFNVQFTDAGTYALAIVPMMVSALIASLLPARRAARINPALTIQQNSSR